MAIDWASELGQRIEQRLKSDPVVWLTTVSDSGAPLPTLVWLWWDGDTVLFYTRPDAVKLRNIQARPAVSLNFNSDPDGHTMDIIFGTAAVDTSAPAVIDHTDYVVKYESLMAYIGMTPQSFDDAFTVPVRITPERIRGF